MAIYDYHDESMKWITTNPWPSVAIYRKIIYESSWIYGCLWIVHLSTTDSSVLVQICLWIYHLASPLQPHLKDYRLTPPNRSLQPTASYCYPMVNPMVVILWLLSYGCYPPPAGYYGPPPPLPRWSTEAHPLGNPRVHWWLPLGESCQRWRWKLKYQWWTPRVHDGKWWKMMVEWWKMMENDGWWWLNDGGWWLMMVHDGRIVVVFPYNKQQQVEDNHHLSGINRSKH